MALVSSLLLLYMKPGGLACRRMSHVIRKWQSFDPLLGRLVAIDVMGEQEMALTGGSHHPSRDPDTRATLKSTRVTCDRPLRPYLPTVITRSLFGMFPLSSSSSRRFLRFVAAVLLQVGAALNPVVVSSLPHPPSI
jgi:hypothetical protein